MYKHADSELLSRAALKLHTFKGGWLLLND